MFAGQSQARLSGQDNLARCFSRYGNGSFDCPFSVEKHIKVAPNTVLENDLVSWLGIGRCVEIVFLIGDGDDTMAMRALGCGFRNFRQCGDSLTSAQSKTNYRRIDEP